MRHLLIVHTLALGALIGCRSDTSIQQHLAGDWLAVQVPPRYESFPGPIGFSFLRDSVEILEGARFVPYRVQGHNINLKMSTNGDEWVSMQVTQLSEDTLALLRGGESWVFRRLHTSRDTLRVESVHFLSGPCFGTCPAIETVLDHSGWFWYRWESVDSVNCQTGWLSERRQRYIRDKVSQAGLYNADSYYVRPDALPDAGAEERVGVRYETGETRVVRSYMDAGPPAFEWLHVPLRDLPKFASVLTGCDSTWYQHSGRRASNDN